MQNNENEVVYLYLDDIIPNRFQPRQIFDERALKELAVSIKEHGVIQPIIVRNIGNKYEIIAGERRYKASALAGLTKIPAIVRNLDDKESSKVALLENLQRKNLNPIEEARTYQKILELDQMTQEDLAKTMGKSQSAVANKLRLLSLTNEVQEALLKEQISERHARTLLTITDSEKQKEMLKKVINNKLTVRELEQELRPKEEVSNAEIEQLLKKEPVPIEEDAFKPTPVISDINDFQASNPNADFNRSIGIDYSTPPKFIDYGDEKTPAVIDDNLKSTASAPIDLDEMRKNAQDINIEKPQANLDSLLQPGQMMTSSPAMDSNDDTSDEGTSSFKFFQPEPDEENQEPKNEEFDKASMFQAPEPIISGEENQSPKKEEFDPISMFQTPETGIEENKLQDSEPSAFDSLLSNSSNTSNPAENLLNENKEVKEANEYENVPYLDAYNNPFARNPIFSDDMEKLMGKEQAKGESIPQYDFNECLDLVRDTVKQIEQSGFKVDTEEMNFEKNYQIVIKITKENSESEK